MDELLQKLLEAEILSEETKKELETAYQAKLDEAISAAKDDAAAAVRAELTEQWIDERDSLIEAVDSKVTDFLETELDELKEDIERFRDLEAEYAEKLVEAKSEMADELKGDLEDLVEKLDTFLEIRLAAEMDELKEDLEEVRKNDFGRRVFEAFAAEFVDNYSDDDNAEVTLREASERLVDMEAALEESERARAELERSIKMDKVLAPLSGRAKDVMEAILRSVDTNMLEEGYKTFIGRVIRETSEKEGKVLAESAEEKDEDDEDEDEDDESKDEDKESKKDKKSKKEDKIEEGVIVTGDKKGLITEGKDDSAMKQQLDYFRKMAGIN